MGNIRWEEYNLKNYSSNSYLIRFLSHKRLCDFLESGAIWFPRACEFGDPLECITARDIKQGELDRAAITKRKKKNLISCWHEATYESLAMWDTYSSTEDDRRKYAIRFKRDRLINYIQDASLQVLKSEPIVELMYGSVRYKNMIREKPALDKDVLVRRAVFRKESAFNYEKELRFVIKLELEFLSRGIALNIGDPQDLEFEILVNPLLPDEDFKIAKEKIRSIGFGHKLKDSRLVKWFKPNSLQESKS